MSEELKNKEVVDGQIVEENVDGAQQGTPDNGNPAPAPQPQGNTQNDGDKPKETFFGKIKEGVKKVWNHPVTQGAVTVGVTALKVGGVALAVIGGVGVAKAIHDSKQTSGSVPEETTLTTDEPDVSEESYSCEEEQEEPKEEFHDVTEDITYYDDVYKSDEETEETTQE